MSRVARSCILQCIKDPNRKIPLPHNKIVYLGRSEETMVVDTCVSRKQVAATANYDEYKVIVQPLGVNHCGCNGYALKKDTIYHFKHGDRLELRLGFHEFDVIFDPEPHNSSSCYKGQPARKKLRSSSSASSTSNVEQVIKDTEKKDASCWETIDNGELLIYTFLNVESRSRIAGFDLDGTLIKTKSGQRFAKNSDDWTFNFPDIPKKLQALHNDDYKIVLFTNQAGIKTDKSKVKEFKAKVEGILGAINVPMQVFVSTLKTIYRKPAPGMWDALCKEKNENVSVDIGNSFYVGDAAGREKNWAPKKSKDHSLGDRLFALNVGLKFYTPEEYFLGARSVLHIAPKFDPRKIKSQNVLPDLKDECELIIMVGSPASGKSHYCKEHIAKRGYTCINRDSLGSWQMCVKAVEKSLQQKKSVVVDNTNSDKAARKRYIDVAKKYNISCRCFHMITTPEHCKHNNRFRELIDKAHIAVGDIVLNSYQKHFEEPSLEEGFVEVVKVDFVPEFKNTEIEKLYKMFLLES